MVRKIVVGGGIVALVLEIAYFIRHLKDLPEIWRYFRMDRAEKQRFNQPEYTRLVKGKGGSIYYRRGLHPYLARLIAPWWA